MVNHEMLGVLQRTGHVSGCACIQCRIGRGEVSQNTATESTLVATRAGGGCNCGGGFSGKGSPQVNADVEAIVGGLLQALNKQQQRRAQGQGKMLVASDRSTLTPTEVADMKFLAHGTQQQQPAPVLNDAYFQSPAFNALSPLTQVYLLGEYRRQQNLDNPEDTLPDLRSYTASTATVDPPVSDAEDIIPPVNNNYESWAEEDRQSRRQHRKHHR